MTWAPIIVSIALLGATCLYTYNTRLQVKEMRAARELETAPKVIAFLEIDHRGIINVVIKNIGKGVAENVKLEVSPAFGTTIEGYEPMKTNLFSDGIKQLVPGQAIEVFLNSFSNHLKKELPDRYEVVLTYFGGLGESIREEKYFLDLTPYKDLIKSPQKTLHELVEAVEKVSKQLAADRPASQKQNGTVWIK